MPSLCAWSCRNIATRHNLSQDGVRIALTEICSPKDRITIPALGIVDRKPTS
jgi:hypothetical protein